MGEQVRPYLFYDVAISICSTCYRKVEARSSSRTTASTCSSAARSTARERVLIADDVDYYRRCREVFLKPPEMPQRYNTPVQWGCPYDCGLCTDHEQHSCLTLVEITDACNLRCPICYAGERARPAGVPAAGGDRAHARRGRAQRGRAGRRADLRRRADDPPATSSTSSTWRKARPIKHLMVNTNGMRIAAGRGVRRAAGRATCPGFEVYLQFDSFEREALLDAARRRPARRPRAGARAAERARHLDDAGRDARRRGSTTTRSARSSTSRSQQPCVRGVTFQPIQDAGRLEGFDPATRPPDADRGAAPHPRADRRLPARGRHPGALPPRLPGDGLRAQARRHGRCR